MLGWLARTKSTVNNRIVGPELRVVMAEISPYVSGYHAYVESNDSRARLTELSCLQICHCFRLGERNCWSSVYNILCISCLTDFKKGL